MLWDYEKYTFALVWGVYLNKPLRGLFREIAKISQLTSQPASQSGSERWECDHKTALCTTVHSWVFQRQYWYCYCQYFCAKVLLLALTVVLTSNVNISGRWFWWWPAGGGRNAERAECRMHFRAECRQGGMPMGGMPMGGMPTATARFRAECRKQEWAEMKAWQRAIYISCP